MINNELNLYQWINQPKHFVVEKNRLIIETEPGTDLWQRTYYGFQNNNAPAFLQEITGDFTFVVKTEFEESSFLYDQCGLLMYIDNENWVKVSVEYENEQFARLGSVVTNLGYSDWATTDIPSDISEMFYKLSRRGQDFYIENSIDGINYRQMRMLHMHKISDAVKVGVYACSPLQSSFNAVFSVFGPGPCQWPEYKNEPSN
jgi:regulation of enolase protein 1 (concanavalin A-like superfamily)